jgi:hypothetical protein
MGMLEGEGKRAWPFHPGLVRREEWGCRDRLWKAGANPGWVSQNSSSWSPLQLPGSFSGSFASLEADR